MIKKRVTAEIYQELQGASKGERGPILAAWEKRLGLSRHAIYRAIRKEFGKQKEIKREKKVSDALIDRVAMVKLQSMDMGYSYRELSTKAALDLLADMGEERYRELAVSTVNRRLKERGLRARQAKIRWEALYANQMHHIDFSRSEYFQVIDYDEKKEDYVLQVTAASKAFRKNVKALRTWLVGLVDAYSRVFIARAYAASGESALLGLEFLDWVYSRPDDGNPLKSVPYRLKSDNGAFEKKLETRMALESIGVNRETSTPGAEKEGNAKIERQWRTLWQKFELKAAMIIGENNKIMLSEYNELLQEYCAEQVKLIHPMMPLSRYEAYRKSIMAYPERKVDEALVRLACRVETRKVDDYLRISYQGEWYAAPEKSIGQRIRVYKNLAGEMMGESISEPGKPFQLKPWRPSEIDNFEHRPHQSYVDKIRSTIKEESGIRKREAGGINQEGRLMMPAREAEQIAVESVFAKRQEGEFATKYHAKLYIANHLRQMGLEYQSDAELWDEFLAGEPSRSEIEAALAQIKTG